MPYCNTRLLALKSIFFSIKDSKPQSARECEFRHASEIKITLPCPVKRLKEDVQADKSQCLVSLYWCDTKMGDFCPHDFKCVAVFCLG